MTFRDHGPSRPVTGMSCWSHILSDDFHILIPKSHQQLNFHAPMFQRHSLSKTGALIQPRLCMSNWFIRKTGIDIVHQVFQNNIWNYFSLSDPHHGKYIDNINIYNIPRHSYPTFLSDILSDILSGTLWHCVSDILFGILSDILFDSLSDILFDILFGILSLTFYLAFYLAF